MTQEQIDSFSLAVLPLQRWLRDNASPHCTAIVDSEKTEVVEGIVVIPRQCCEHSSDCAVHNEPAMPAGPCDCGANTADEQRRGHDNAN